MINNNIIKINDLVVVTVCGGRFWGKVVDITPWPFCAADDARGVSFHVHGPNIITQTMQAVPMPEGWVDQPGDTCDTCKQMCSHRRS